MKKQIIWLVNPYGPIPGEGWRDYSFTLIGNVLSHAGFEVIWWTSNFSHHFKRHRSNGWEDRYINDNFKIRLVPSPGYKKNISLGRVFRDFVFGVRTYIRGKGEERPICVIYYESPLTFGYAGPRLSSYHGCSLIYHQMDLWPELIINAFPVYIKSILTLFFGPVFRYRKNVYNKLDGVMALATYYLDVILEEVPSTRSIPNCIVYNGTDVLKIREYMTYDSAKVYKKSSNEICAIFAGSLGPSYDIECLVQLGYLLEASGSPITILIAGDGPMREYVLRASDCCKNIYYLGILTFEQLALVYGECDIGLSAYSSKSNVQMPDKFYDYTAAGLAIINSLDGEASQLINSRHLGLQYEAGNQSDLYSKIVCISENQFLLNTMRANSRATGLEFDGSTQHSKLPSFVRSVLKID